MAIWFNEKILNIIREAKKNGATNLELMKKYKIGYAELREILDGGK